jgi:hypothetical protein
MDYIKLLMDVGFTEAQAEALETLFAKYPHHHGMDEVDGLEEVLDELGEEDEVIDDSDDEED